MSLQQTQIYEELDLEPKDNWEYTFELLHSFLSSYGIVLRRNENNLFVHFDLKSSKKLARHIIKSTGSVSSEIIEIAENERIIAADKMIMELLSKSRLLDLKKELDVIIGGIFVVSRNRGLSKFSIKKVSNYYIGFPRSVSDIPEYMKIINPAGSDSLIDKIVRTSIMHLLLRANEFFFSKKPRSGVLTFLFLWGEEIDKDILDAVEFSVLNISP